MVLSCKPRVLAKVSKKEQKKKEKTPQKEMFEVALQDTILFPEDGGQPNDTGFVDGVPCKAVENIHGVATHLLTTALDPGSGVEVKVDWARR